MNSEWEVEFGADEVYAKNKGNALLSYLLDCVRRGNCSDIEAAVYNSEYDDMIRLLVGNELSFANTVFQYLLPQVVRVAVDSGMMWMAAKEIYQTYTQKAKQARSVCTLLELYNRMFFDFADSVAHMKEEYQFSWMVRQCRSYINENIYKQLSVCHIAEALQISKSHLSHIYKQETGETISDFIRHMKISKAKQLLQYTLLSLTDVGEKLGYCSQSHFTDSFRKETGMTPSQFCNKYKCREIMNHKK
jgi:AraC-like DNA-binding protein